VDNAAMITDTQLISRLRGDNSSLSKKNNRLKSKNIKLMNELTKIKGMIIRLQAELEDER